MKQDPETQRKLMGPGRFDLWQSGQVDLRDMVYIKENPEWGGSPAMRTLEDIRGLHSVSLDTGNGIIFPLPDSSKQEIIENGQKSLRFFHHLDPINDYAKTVDPIPGYQDVFVHGGQTGFSFRDYGDKVIHEDNINVREFAEFVKESTVYNGGKIRLVSCGTGNINAKTAEWFAEEMGVEILAPTEDVNMWWDYFSVHDKQGHEGIWRRFYPDGRSEDY